MARHPKLLVIQGMATLCFTSACHFQDAYTPSSTPDLDGLATDMTLLDASRDAEDARDSFEEDLPSDAPPKLHEDQSPDLIPLTDMEDMEGGQDMLDLDAAAPRCAPLPASCLGPPAPTTLRFITSSDACQFALEHQEDVARFAAFTSQMQAWRGAPIPIQELDFNRIATPGISERNANRLRNHDVFSFTWQGGDATSSTWYPQGITGTSDAYQDTAGHPRQLIVSWYDSDRDNEPLNERGVRISIVNLTDPITYRHILLVEPGYNDEGVLEMRPLLASEGGKSSHGGGIVWVGNLLYVAETRQGMRVFDLEHIYQVQADEPILQFDAQAVRGLGYRYVLPQRAQYDIAAESCAPLFSFIGLDRTSSPPQITSGEYSSDDAQGRLMRWRVDDSTGWLVEEPDGFVRAHDAHVGAHTRMQGALSIGEDIVLSCSSQIEGGDGRLYRARPGEESRITAWPYGAEDLYYERDTQRIWTPAEHPGTRDTVSIPYVPF